MNIMGEQNFAESFFLPIAFSKMSSSDHDTIDLEVLNDYVAHILPAVSSIHRAEIVEKLLEVGVEKPSDLQYVDEGDLELLNLKKVQARKLIKDWDKFKGNVLYCCSKILFTRFILCSLCSL